MRVNPLARGARAAADRLSPAAGSRAVAWSARFDERQDRRRRRAVRSASHADAASTSSTRSATANGVVTADCRATCGEPSMPSAEATCTSASAGRSGTTKSEGSCGAGRPQARERMGRNQQGPVASLACSRVAPNPPDPTAYARSSIVIVASRSASRFPGRRARRHTPGFEHALPAERPDRTRAPLALLRSARSGATLPARTSGDGFVDGPGETQDRVQARHLEHLPHGLRHGPRARACRGVRAAASPPSPATAGPCWRRSAPR